MDTFLNQLYLDLSYLINSFGIDGAAIASLLSTFLAFVITNFTNPIEIYNIIECFGFKKQKQAAKDILKMIFVNKKPEKKEKTND